MEVNEITDRIIGAAIDVHPHLGPGLPESAYEECLCYELSRQGLTFQRQAHLPIHYKGIQLPSAHRMDLVVEDAAAIAYKATEEMPPVYAAQAPTCLRSGDQSAGLLIHINVVKSPRLSVSTSNRKAR
jgi:GxxExxY protein